MQLLLHQVVVAFNLHWCTAVASSHWFHWTDWTLIGNGAWVVVRVSQNYDKTQLVSKEAYALVDN